MHGQALNSYAVGDWVTVPLPEPPLAAETGALAVGATWIDPVRPPVLWPWLVPPAVGVWVTLPLPVLWFAAETGALAVGATWMGPVRVPDWPVLPAVGVWVTVPLDPVESAETGVLVVGATWIGPIRLPVGELPVGGVVGWVPVGGVVGWLPVGGARFPWNRGDLDKADLGDAWFSVAAIKRRSAGMVKVERPQRSEDVRP